jgi:hypothetical protein
MIVLKSVPKRIPLTTFLFFMLFVGLAESFSFKDLKEFQSAKTKLPTLEISAATIPEMVKPGEKFTLHLQVILETGSHIYSLEENYEGEQLATQIEINSPNLHPLSVWTETPPKLSLDGVLEKTVKIHESLVQFNRDYKATVLLSPKDNELSGGIIYRICDNRTCSLPQKSKFKTSLNIKK